MDESGTTPPDWTRWLHSAGAEGAGILRGIAATMGAAAEARDGTPVFVEAWQQALNEEPADADSAAEHFSAAVQQSLRRMREDTQAGVAALDGALAGLRGQATGLSEHWLTDAYHTARTGRENADAAEALQTAFHDYVQALIAYQTELSRSVEAGLEAFQTALAERKHDGAPPADLTELHALWIESAEPAYEQVLNSRAYAGAFAALHNAAMSFAGAAREYAQPLLEALGMPSRSEIDAMHRHMSDIRRERNRSRRLESEVALLRQEVEALRRELRETTGGDPATRRPQTDRH
ncbi:hypothetical protein H0Z60_04310 [Ectothiorhodospiraceae bacterium WFHF3C12]|nr:hypothetical protein [Ectothiorhodospiraceae bacterium WFHF3C12]